MATRIVYSLLYILSLLPLGALYALSDIFFLINFYGAGYRREIIRSNLQHAFPEKDREALRRTEKQFYRHFANLMAETVKLVSMSAGSLLERVKLVENEDFKHLANTPKTAIVLTAHYGNWEWGGMALDLHMQKKTMAAYKVQRSAIADNLMHRLRSRFGIEPVPMKLILRRLLREQDTAPIGIFIADQTSTQGEAGLWMEFMHREVPFFAGPESMARRFDLPVYMLFIHRRKRGRYEIRVELISDNSNEMREGDIMKMYIRKLENALRQQPPFWLWSHRRWKHADRRVIF
ncbi:MAG: lysophospholipid acyltransferase family protein [Bacteroidia bacterium]